MGRALRASATPGSTLSMTSMLNSPASGMRSAAQNIVRNPIMSMITQALHILLFRDRYVFCHITWAAGGAGLAIICPGVGSRIAWTAIWHAAVDSIVTNASGVGVYSCFLASSIL